MFSGILKALGCHVPQPEVKADTTNPKGFAEPAWVVDFHTRLLRKAGVHVVDARPSAWARTAQIALDREVESELREWLAPELDHGAPVVVKDPRLLWFPSLWEGVGAGLGASIGFATVLRRPQEVLQSRRTSYGDRRLPTSAVAGWINTVLYTERATRGSVRAFARYDDLMADWTLTVSDVCETLGLPILENVTTKQLRTVNQFIDPALRRSTSDWSGSGVHDEVAELADETFRLLDLLVTKDPAQAEEATRGLDDLRTRYAAFYELAESVAESSIVPLARQRRAAKRRRPKGAAGSGPAKATPKRTSSKKVSPTKTSSTKAGRNKAAVKASLPRRVKRRAKRSLRGLQSRAGG